MASPFVSNPFVTLCLIIGLGMALGKIKLGGLSLGSSGVLFLALLSGHLGGVVPEGTGIFGLILFVYCVGLGAGGRFFSAMANEGSRLAILGALIVLTGGATAWALALLLDLPYDLATGLFAGALTSTPALAAATDTLNGDSAAVSIGYGIAYPFGVAGVVIFVQLLHRLFRKDLDVLAKSVEEKQKGDEPILSKVVEITNKKLVGQKIAENPLINSMGCQVTRIVKEGRYVPLSYEDTFMTGMEIYLVGQESQLQVAADYLGMETVDRFARDTARERRQLIVKSSDFSGKSLRDLQLLREYQVVVSRVTRLGITFVPTPETRIENNDVLTTVGPPDALERLAKALGHRNQAFDETDLLSLGFGLAAGIFLGMLRIQLPGTAQISLGMAGGPLLVGLILGHFGRVGWIVGFIPRPTRVLLQELGLVLFLADAGVKGGSTLLETVQLHGPSVFLMGAAVTIIPLAITLPIALKLLKMNLLQALGGICGGMTSTPALGALTAKTDSQVPVVSYATAYPIALILMTIAAKVLLGVAE